MPEELKKFHAAHAAKARELYLNDLNPAEGAADWGFSLEEARRIITDALSASNNLRNLEQALVASGEHMLVFRQLTAPPVSQDQFKLRCPDWPKASEKSKSSIRSAEAYKVAACFSLWRDHSLTGWLDHGREPTAEELRAVFTAVAPLIAGQRIATARRNRYATKQEQGVIDLLLRKGWVKMPSLLIDTRAAVPERHFMHKTRFATASKTPQEVDIACGLKDTYVAAVECKVTNDETNSVKRVNDVIKKAEAWRAQWGNFVITVAILQGVIAAKDVSRLIDHHVEVFWSHDLQRFEAWIDKRL